MHEHFTFCLIKVCDLVRVHVEGYILKPFLCLMKLISQTVWLV